MVFDAALGCKTQGKIVGLQPKVLGDLGFLSGVEMISAGSEDHEQGEGDDDGEDPPLPAMLIAI